MDVAARFAALIETLCGAVAARGAKGAFGAANGALVVLLWSRLRRAAFRFGILAAGAPPPRRRASRPRHRAARKPVLALPRRAAWLLAPVPEASAVAGRLRDLLQTPEAQALIASEPRAGRLLRPLCRALGLRLPACLRLPSRPRRSRPAAVALATARATAPVTAMPRSAPALRLSPRRPVRPGPLQTRAPPAPS